MLRLFLFFTVIFLALITNSLSFQIRSNKNKVTEIKIFAKNHRYIRESTSSLNSNKENHPGNEPYLQHVCPSCSFVYDEEKGFKKKYPPG
jgi:dolichol kinase